MTSAIASATMTMQQWALARIATQRPLEKGRSLFEQIPASVLDRSLPRWEFVVDKKVLNSFTPRSQLEGRCLIVFLPGANTPTCNNHLPILVEMADRLHGIGVRILVVCVNRTDDMYLWAQQHDIAHKLTFIPDMDGEFTLAAGVAAWSDRLGLMGNRVAIITNEEGVVLDVVPELDGASKQCNGQCAITGIGIEKTVKDLFS